MKGFVVSSDRHLKDIQVLVSIGTSEVTIHSTFQSAIESFYHAGFCITGRRKMMNIFIFHQFLKCVIVKFFSIIRLQCFKIFLKASVTAIPFLDFIMGPTQVYFENASTTTKDNDFLYYIWIKVAFH